MQAGEDRGAVEAEIFEIVAGIAGKAAAVIEEVGDRDLLGRIGVVQLEGGIEIGDARVPGDQPLAHQRRHDGRGDGLGEGGELEHGVGIDLAGLTGLAYAEPSEIDHLVLIDDGDGEPRHLALGDRIFRHLLELWDRGLDLLLGHGVCRGGASQ